MRNYGIFVKNKRKYTMLTHFYAAQIIDGKRIPIVYKFDSKQKRDYYVSTHTGSYPVDAITAAKSRWKKVYDEQEEENVKSNSFLT